MNTPSPRRRTSSGLPTPPLEPTTACAHSLRADLKAYADRELGPLRRALVSAHLRTCPVCREELADMKKITELLAAASPATDAALAPQLRSRVLSRLDGVVPAAPSFRPAPLWRRQPALVFGGGGTVLAASVAAFYVMNPASHAPNTDAMPGVAALSYVQDYDEKFPVATSAASAPGAASPERAAKATAASEVTVSDKGGATSDTLALPAASAPREYRARSISAAAPAAEVTNSPFAGTPPAVFEPQSQARSVASANGRGSVSSYKGAAARSPQFTGRVTGSVSGSVATTASEIADDGRQVHKEASLGLRVSPGGLQTASDKIEDLVKSSGGFVASNNLSTDDTTEEKSADLTVRVPTKDFETVMAALAKMGDVVSKQVSGEDITEKTTDATTAEQVLVNEAKETAQKLANQSMSERRTGQKEAELRQIRMQLAQTRARLGLLRRMATLGTINVSLTEKKVKKAAVAAGPTTGFFAGMQETNKSAMQAFQTAVRVPLVLLVWVLAFSPIWVPLLLAYRWASLKTLASRAISAPAAAGEEG